MSQSQRKEALSKGRAMFGSKLQNYGDAVCECGHKHDGDVCDDCSCRVFHKAVKNAPKPGVCMCDHKYEDHKEDEDGYMPCTKCRCTTYRKS